MAEQQTNNENPTTAKATEQKSGRLYGRKWKILFCEKVDDQGSDEYDSTNNNQLRDIWVDLTMLRSTFKIQRTTQSNAICTLEVYNMSASSENEIIRSGWEIFIEAGYQDGPCGELFRGNIIQVIRSHDTGLDYKLQIIAMQGKTLFDDNYINAKLKASSTPRTVIGAVCKNAVKQIVVGDVSENLSEQQLARGKVLFGTPAKYLRDLVIGNDAYYWTGNDNKLNVQKMSDKVPNDHCFVLSPDHSKTNEANRVGLVGIPQYEDEGVKVKMLMEPRMNLSHMVKVNSELINRKSLIFNKKGKVDEDKSNRKTFDKYNEYKVVAITHSGDTHGNDWYTEVIAINVEENVQEESTDSGK